MPPDYLYKYTPLRDRTDEMLDKRYAALLTDSQLWFSAPSSFNDPMDCKPVFRFGGATPKEQQGFRETVLKGLAMRDFPDVHGQEFITCYGEYQQQYPAFNDELCEIGHQLLSSDLRSRLVGVLCLSECERDPVMFYHYGDKHKGMCLKFRTLDFFEHANPVDYRAMYPVVNYFDSTDNEAQYGTIFLTKYEGWEYEHEYRIVNFDQHRSPRLTSYPPELLEGVIFGYLMPQEDRDYARGLLEKRGTPVTLYEAKIGREQYLMDIVQID
ncbi:DUF2971 domain-containing protein [Paraburkholderia sp. BL10I2N1]|uniref:DUF2971 domain-containing protein n=1 Tax=Paraburkholderia sp. BL10I2N1 TaxID=1938796 RepID=UPI0010601709|nr:DUF2971 domain-containing protein [Paraburkholderia sp. BL10I2N1]TDN62327.1 DUF2971 family protein [Paraburkholderia sp. BL10I2N1]